MITNIVSRIFVLALLLLVSSPTFSSVTDKVFSDYIDEVREATSSLIGQAESSGNALLTKAATEMEVLLSTAVLLAGNETDKKIQNLSVEVRRVVNSIEQVNQNASKLSGDAYSLKDSLVVDVKSILSSIPGIEDKFFVQKVSGLTHLYSTDKNYKVSIMGSGLGLPSADIRSEIDIEIAGKRIDPLRIHRVNSSTSTIEISHSDLANYFDNKKLSVVELIFKITYERKKGLVFKKWESEPHSVPVYLSLFPKRAGNITVTAGVPEYDWRFSRKESKSRTTNNHHCEKHCKGEPTRTNYTIEILTSGTGASNPIEGSKILRKPALMCHRNMQRKCKIGFVKMHVPQSAKCPGRDMGLVDTSTCRSWNKVNYTKIENDGKRAIASFDVWSHPTTWTLTADVFRFVAVRSKEITMSKELEYGRLVEFVVPKNTTLSKVNGKLVTGQSFEFVAGNNEPDGILKIREEVSEPFGKKYIYMVTRPDGM